MDIDPKVVAAIVTGRGSLCIAIVAWIRTLGVQRKSQEHEMRVAQLQNEFSSSKERLKSELAKELAAEESILRVHGELRVRMFELGAKAVDEAGVNLQSLIYVYKNYWYAEAADEVAPRTRLAEVTEALIGTGMFLPPELTDVFESARSYVLGRMKQLLHEAHDTKNRNHAGSIAQTVFDEADQKAKQFREAALEWKRSEWEKLTNVGIR